MQKRAPSSVLFVCTQNAIRSPMAAAIAHNIVGHNIYVASAGVTAGDPDPFVGIIMNEIGLDLTRHRPHSLDDLADNAFDLVITLSPEAEAHARELAKTLAIDVEHWTTPDPSRTSGNRETVLDAYRGVRDGLKRRINERFLIRA
jgi:protein-tyrosine-phosphatase